MSNDGSVIARGLSRTYRGLNGPVTALHPLDLTVPRGILATIAGPSGSGKSTLLRLAAGLDRPTDGEISIATGEGRLDIGSLGTRQRRAWRRRNLGYVFQRPADNLILYLSALEQLDLAATVRGFSPRPGEAAELLELAGLSHRAHERPAALSGGEQQRLALCAAVIGNPGLIVADEPTAELDRANGRGLVELLTRVVARGANVLMCSHDNAAIEASSWVARLERGRLISISGTA